MSPIARSSARAAPTVTPGFIRPTIVALRVARLV
jgi:hypothetical protein